MKSFSDHKLLLTEQLLIPTPSLRWFNNFSSIYSSMIFVSFLGSTECRFLENIEEIVTQSLPLENLRFFKDKDVAETYLLNQITFCEEMIQVNFQGVRKKRNTDLVW